MIELSKNIENGGLILSPEEMTPLFKYTDKQYIKGEIEKIRTLDDEDRKKYFKTLIDGLENTKDDMERSWNTSALRWVGGNEAYDSIFGVIEKRRAAKDGIAEDRYTIFYGIKAIHDLEKEINDEKKATLYKVYKKIADNVENKEDSYWIHACKSILASSDPKKYKGYHDDLEKIIESVKKASSWEAVRQLRVFREFPVLDLQPKLLELAKDSSQFTDTRVKMIEALGECGEGVAPESVKGLGELLIARNCDRQIRLNAALALKKLRKKEATSYLVDSIENDWDAEIRKQAVDALRQARENAAAVRVLIDRVLDKDFEHKNVDNFADAIRRINEDGCAESYLDVETWSLDAERASNAQEVLIKLGGLESVSRLMAKKKVISNIDELLQSSEKVVRDDHDQIMSRAMSNFRFAMAVNSIIVALGIALFIFGLYKMFTDSSSISMWLPTSGGGLFSAILVNFLKDPKRMAKEDLATLMTVNVIFLGFIRQVHEIDATFKHAYFEDNFGVADMEKTVDKLNETMAKTLAKIYKYLKVTHEGVTEEDEGKAGVGAQNKEKDGKENKAGTNQPVENPPG